MTKINTKPSPPIPLSHRERGKEGVRAIIILTLLAALLYFFKLGSFSLYDAAETTYGEFVKNILQMGDWITLHYNGQIIFDKPPLYFWLAAALSKLIGFSEFSMRFWAALAGILTVITTFALGKAFYNERIGFFSGIITMTAFQFLVQSRIAELDIVLTLLLSLALLFFYYGYQSGNKRYYLLSYFPMALAVLIKGIIGLAIPFWAIFLFLLIKRELGKIKELYLLPGLLIAAAISLPWYVIEYGLHGKVFLDFALGFLFLSRFGSTVSGHTGPWYYYFLALLLGFAPWSHLLPFGLWQTFKNRRNDPELLTLCFVVPVFIVFSIAKTKIPNYILPLYPFLALGVGKVWDDLFNQPKKLFTGFTISNLFLLVISALLIIGFVIAGTQYPTQYSTLIPDLKILAGLLIVGCSLSVLFYFSRAFRLSFYVLPAMVFAIMFFLTLAILPRVEEFKGTRFLGNNLSKAIAPQKEIAAFEIGNRPSVVLYNCQPINFLSDEKELITFLKNKRGYVFTTADEYEKIKGHLPAGTRIFSQKGDLLIITNL
jgi:hypothetical protein